jgi:phospholipid transport system substrate-binding protein
VPKLASRRVVLQLVATAAMFTAVPVVGPAVAADPSQIVQNTAQQVIEIVKTKTGAARQAAILAILQANFDMPAMGRAALGTHWNTATEQERARFLKAVATAEAKAYSERFGQYGGQTLTLGSRLNQTSGQPIKLEWEVRGDRITDVKVEGVSMVMTRRSDFNSYIQNHGGKVEPLVSELEARAAR